MTKSLVVSLVLALLLAATSVRADSTFIKREVKRLPPSAFTVLPATIRRALETRGCTIPQAYDNDAPHNVIRGEFMVSGRLDWAVLCSWHNSSSILIFENDSASEITELDASPDDMWFQSIGNGQHGYSRMIAVAGKRRIAAYHANAKVFSDEPDLPPIRHDGIDQFFVHKASAVRYYHQGRWLKLSGAD